MSHRPLVTAAIIGAAPALSFALAFAITRTPPSVNQGLALTILAVALAGTVAASYQARSMLVAAGVLVVCFVAVSVGYWLPYKLELWDLTLHDFETDDLPGSDGLWVWLYFGTPIMIVVGLVIGVITRVVRYYWIDSRSQPREAAH